MKVNKYLSTYHKAEDLLNPALITIERIESEEIGGEEKLVLYARGDDIGYPLNKTSIRTLVEVCKSEDTDEWLGGQVVVYNDRSVTFEGRRVGGLRFRAPKEGAVLPKVEDPSPF